MTRNFFRSFAVAPVTLILPVAILALIAMMVLPIPTLLLDDGTALYEHADARRGERRQGRDL